MTPRAEAGQTSPPAANRGQTSASPPHPAMLSLGPSTPFEVPHLPCPLPTCSYVPLVWGATLAYYSEPLLREAGTVLQVCWAQDWLRAGRQTPCAILALAAMALLPQASRSRCSDCLRPAVLHLPPPLPTRSPTQVGAVSLGMAPEAVPGIEAHPAVVSFIQVGPLPLA